MFPFINIGPYTIASYGFCAVLGFLSGLLLIAVLCRQSKKITFDDALYIYTFAAFGALIGAKLLYLVTVLPDFVRDTVEILQKLRNHGPEASEEIRNLIAGFASQYLFGGLVYYGGLFGAILGARYAADYFEKNWDTVCKVLMPSLPLVAGFGRLGCFMAGCCYGMPTKLPIGILFYHSHIAPNGIALFPTQILEAGFDFLLVAVMLFAGRRRREIRNERTFGHRLAFLWHCHPLSSYIGLYAVFRFILEFFRGDVVRGIWYGLSVSQWISLLLLSYIGMRRHSRKFWT